MKTFVLIVSKNFPSYTFMTGQPTQFKERLLTGKKIHTIRENFPYWEKVAAQVNAGQAVLSIREWTARPYHSKQEEIMRLTKMGVQHIAFYRPLYPSPSDVGWTEIDGKPANVNHAMIALNDGLRLDQFQSWFPLKFTGCIIHFTDFRY